MAPERPGRDHRDNSPYEAHNIPIHQPNQTKITDIIHFLETNDEYVEGVLKEESEAKKRVADFVTTFTVVVRIRLVAWRLL
jgi:hypothetical protein